MEDFNLESKLALLDPNKYDEPSRSLIKQWKERLPMLSARADFVKHPVAIEWLKMKKDEVDRINIALSTNQDLSEAQRQRLFGEKKAHEMDISFISFDPLSEIQLIEKDINVEMGFE